MLHAVHDGSDKPTGIFYAANLSYRSGKDVLHLLVQNDLLREREIPGKKKTKKRYSVTEKGLNLIRHLDRVKEIINIDESQDIFIENKVAKVIDRSARKQH